MNVKDCPLGNKVKLKLVLHGRDGVCRGWEEKDDNGVYQRYKICDECPFFDKEHDRTIWAPYIPINKWAEPQPSLSWRYTTTTTTTSTTPDTTWGIFGTNNTKK